MSEELSEMKTDIALIKSDVNNIQKFFVKVENSLDMMTELAQKVAVQEEVQKNQIDRLEDLESYVKLHRTEDLERSRVMMNRLEEYRKASKEDHQKLAEHNASKRQEHNNSLLEQMKKHNEEVIKRLDIQDQKIRALENWKYYMMGVGAVLIFVFAKINWPGLFG